MLIIWGCSTRVTGSEFLFTVGKILQLFAAFLKCYPDNVVKKITFSLINYSTGFRAIKTTDITSSTTIYASGIVSNFSGSVYVTGKTQGFAMENISNSTGESDNLICVGI
ncbi:MAG: hypothetical protein ABIR81_11370 [Ginsengibacter sp.]